MTLEKEAKEMARKALGNMSYAELSAMKAWVARLNLERQAMERAEVRQKLINPAKQHGFEISDLFGRKGRRGGGVAIKYRDPTNPLHAWTGRGRMPRWMVAAMRGGKAKKEEFLI
jgi:DNA-binding protein H-NS